MSINKRAVFALWPKNYAELLKKYTDYVNDLFTPDYMYDNSHTLVFPQLERFDDDPNTPLVYDKKRGIIDAV